MTSAMPRPESTRTPRNGTRTLAQRHRALDLANGARGETATFRATLVGIPGRGAALEIARVLIDEPERIGHIRIHELLGFVPRIGERKVRRMLWCRQGWAIWPLLRVRDLTVRQRTQIAGELVAYASRIRTRTVAV